MFKGRIATQWKVYTAQHLNAKGIKLKIKKWVPKLINTMWDHTTRIWHYRNDAVHSRDTKQVAQFKIDALENEKERIKNKHEELRHKLHEFQSRHLERLVDMEQLHYNGHKCWTELAILYLDEAENRIIPIEATIERYLHGRSGVG
jgi:chromosome segregation ATPase